MIKISFKKHQTCASCSWGNSYDDCKSSTVAMDCTGLINNAEWWPGRETFTQTNNGGTWTPTSHAAVYKAEDDSTECSYRCKSGFAYQNGACVEKSCPSGQHPEGDDCVSNTRTGQACGSKPSNPAPTSWWGTGLVDQTWTDGTWTPTTTAFCSNTSTGATDCSYKCEGYFHCKEDQSGCESNTRPQNCAAKPANSVWNDGHTGDNVGRYQQTWSNGSWSAAPATEYSETEGDCHWKCESNYHHENGACVPDLPECSLTSETPCKDSANGRIWSARAQYAKEWSEAKTYCADLEEGGYPKGTWQLPTISDLRTIIVKCTYNMPEGSCGVTDECTTSSCYDQLLCNSTTHSECKSDTSGCGSHSKLCETNSLWSLSQKDGSSIWVVKFSEGNIGSASTNDTRYVRCVIK